MRYLLVLTIGLVLQSVAVAQQMKPGNILPSGTLRTGSAVTAVAFSPDSSVLVGGMTGRIAMWNATTGQPMNECAGFDSTVTSVAFSPDSKTLASGSQWNDGKVRLWDVATGALKTTLDQRSPVTAIAYSKSGNLLASAGGDNAIRIWNAVDGTLKHTLPGGQYRATALYWPNDNNLQSAGAGLLAPRNGERIREEGDGTATGSWEGRDVEWIQQFKTEGEYIYWDASKPTMEFRIALPDATYNCVFNADGKLLAFAGSGATRLKWADTQTEETQWGGGDISVWGVGTTDDNISLIGKGKGSAVGAKNGLITLAWAPDSKKMAWASWSTAAAGPPTAPNLNKFDLERERTAAEVPGVVAPPVVNSDGPVSYSSDGRFLIQGDGNPHAREGHGIQIWGIVQ